jgi:hypothetical protein
MVSSNLLPAKKAILASAGLPDRSRFPELQQYNNITALRAHLTRAIRSALVSVGGYSLAVPASPGEFSSQVLGKTKAKCAVSAVLAAARVCQSNKTFEAISEDPIYRTAIQGLSNQDVLLPQDSVFNLDHWNSKILQMAEHASDLFQNGRATAETQKTKPDRRIKANRPEPKFEVKPNTHLSMGIRQERAKIAAEIYQSLSKLQASERIIPFRIARGSIVSALDNLPVQTEESDLRCNLRIYREFINDKLCEGIIDPINLIEPQKLSLHVQTFSFVVVNKAFQALDLLVPDSGAESGSQIDPFYTLACAQADQVSKVEATGLQNAIGLKLFFSVADLGSYREALDYLSRGLKAVPAQT